MNITLNARNGKFEATYELNEKSHTTGIFTKFVDADF